MKYYKPLQVVSPKEYLKVIKIICDYGEKSYSIAELDWDGKICYGIRWNIARNEWNDEEKKNENKKCIGMPSSRGYPVWFILPDNFNKFIESSIVDNCK